MATLAIDAEVRDWDVKTRDWDDPRWLPRGVGIWSHKGKDWAWVVKLDRGLTDKETDAVVKAFDVGLTQINGFLHTILPMQVTILSIHTYRRIP